MAPCIVQHKPDNTRTELREGLPKASGRVTASVSMVAMSWCRLQLICLVA